MQYKKRKNYMDKTKNRTKTINLKIHKKYISKKKMTEGCTE